MGDGIIRTHPPVTRMTKAEWDAKGKELFGEDYFKWKFVCPACGNVATVEDYKPFKDQGANPDSARCNCIGRYDGHMNVPMGTAQPCNYAGFGLFNFCPVRVITEDGEEVSSFAFYEGEKENGE